MLATDSDTPRSIPWLAIGALVAVNALWGFSFPVMKSINELMDLHFGVTESTATNTYRVASSAWMIGLRFTFAFAMICVCLSSIVRNASRAEWMAGFWIAIFFYAGLVLQVIGLAMIPASRSGFLTSLTTVFTPFLGAVVFRRIPSMNMFIGAMVAVAGVAVLTGLFVANGDHFGLAPDAHERWTLGDTLTTIGSFLFAFQILLIDHFGKRLNSVAITPGMFLTTAILAWVTVAAIMLYPLNNSMDTSGAATALEEFDFSGFWSLTLKPSFLGMVLVLGSVCSLISFVWMNKYQPFITAAQASVIYSLEPVFASLWALFIPGCVAMLTGLLHANETISWNLLIGGGMILVANVIALYPTSTRQSS